MGHRNLILNIEYATGFGAYWMIYAVIGSFASIFMLAKGYNNSQIGITLAGGNVLAILAQPWIADHSDKADDAAVIRIPILMTAAIMILTGGLFVLRSGSYVMIAVYICILALHALIQPLMNSIPFRFESRGAEVYFGIGRAGGSAGFALISAFLGTLVEKHGVMSIPVCCEIACVLYIGLMLLLRYSFEAAPGYRSLRRSGDNEDGYEAGGDEAGGETRPVSSEPPYEEIGIGEFISRNGMFFVLCIGLVGLFFSNSVLSNYMAQIATDVGATTEQVGRILSLMGILEIPTMLFYGKIRRHFNSRTLIKVAAFGFSAKIVICWLAKSVTVLYLAQFMQLIAFALMMPAMVYFIDEIMSHGEAVKGQSLFTMMFPLSTIVASLAGGWLLDVSGARALTFVASVVTIAGMIVVFLTVDRVGAK